MQTKTRRKTPEAIISSSYKHFRFLNTISRAEKYLQYWLMPQNDHDFLISKPKKKKKIITVMIAIIGFGWRHPLFPVIILFRFINFCRDLIFGHHRSFWNITFPKDLVLMLMWLVLRELSLFPIVHGRGRREKSFVIGF